MEILKKSIFIVLITILAINPFKMVKSQDYNVLQEAFLNSYKRENKGEYTKAVDTLKAVYLADSYEINLRLGWLSYKAGLFTESAAYYQKAMALKPYSLEARFGYTYPASALGNWEQVANQYIEVLKIDPQNTIANYKLGLIYYGKKDYSTAQKHFEKVVNLYPFDYDSVIMFAWTNFKLGNYREAKVLFNKALLNKPGDSSALDGLKLIK
jgi:tetratricopeptide (TPR) repeat protein